MLGDATQLQAIYHQASSTPSRLRRLTPIPAEIQGGAVQASGPRSWHPSSFFFLYNFYFYFSYKFNKGHNITMPNYNPIKRKQSQFFKSLIPVCVLIPIRVLNFQDTEFLFLPAFIILINPYMTFPIFILCLAGTGFLTFISGYVFINFISARGIHFQ